MQKILVVSDTHGKLSNLREVIRKVRPVDRILDLGDVEGQEDEIRAMADCPVEFVCGNCDRTSREPWDRVLEIEGHRVLMTHGHHYSVGSTLERLKTAAAAEDADLVLFGHTHTPEKEEIDGRTFLNPGSISRPRQSGYRPSFAIVEIDDKGEFHTTINYLNHM